MAKATAHGSKPIGLCSEECSLQVPSLDLVFIRFQSNTCFSIEQRQSVLFRPKHYQSVGLCVERLRGFSSLNCSKRKEESTFHSVLPWEGFDRNPSQGFWHFGHGQEIRIQTTLSSSLNSRDSHESNETHQSSVALMSTEFDGFICFFKKVDGF